MISDEKQYEYIGSVIIDRIDRVRDAFKLYLQLFAAIVGGSIWLSTQNISPVARRTYAFVSNALVGLLIVVTVIMVYAALRSWWRSRETMSNFDGGQYPIPGPEFQAIVAEIAMLLCMIASAAIFFCFNPFLVPSN